MAEVTTITAQVRERAGKGAARATRRAGRVPAVIYGNKVPPEMISLDPKELELLHRSAGFFSRVLEIDVDGKKHQVLARDVQLDPLYDRPIHVDFMRFSATTTLNIDVPVLFVNESLSPGLKTGGVLNVVRHTIEMNCAANNIPESIIIDLTGCEVGDSIHISSIELPDDAQPTITDRDFTIATIAAPSVLATVEEEEIEAEEAAAAEALEAAPAADEDEGSED